MNAAETLKQTTAAADQRAYEPSMEEILASIRRIIADDQSLPNRAFVRDGEASLRAALDSPVTSHGPAEGVSYRAREPETGLDPLTPVATEAVPVAAQEPAVFASPLRAPSARALGHIAAPQFVTPDSPGSPHGAWREGEPSAGALNPMHSSAEVAPETRGGPLSPLSRKWVR